MGHLKTPGFVDMFIASFVRVPSMIALLGHNDAHFLQVSQNSVTPKRMGWSGTRGKSVNSLLIRILEPYFGVTKSPFRPNSPSPASMAMGILKAVSFPMGIALYPRLRINAANVPVVNAIRAYPLAVAAAAIQLGATSDASGSIS